MLPNHLQQEERLIPNREFAKGSSGLGTEQATFRIGTSGYQYNHWKRVFYPETLPKKEWFTYYAQHFDTVEINNTFYRLPAAATFDT